MIKCYDERAYAFFMGIFGMLLFLPIALICIGGSIASGILWLINLFKGIKRK